MKLNHQDKRSSSVPINGSYLLCTMCTGRGEAVRASVVGQRGRLPRAGPAARHLHPTGICGSAKSDATKCVKNIYAK